MACGAGIGQRPHMQLGDVTHVHHRGRRLGEHRRSAVQQALDDLDRRGEVAAEDRPEDLDGVDHRQLNIIGGRELPGVALGERLGLHVRRLRRGRVGPVGLVVRLARRFGSIADAASDVDITTRRTSASAAARSTRSVPSRTDPVTIGQQSQHHLPGKESRSTGDQDRAVVLNHAGPRRRREASLRARSRSR
jgi:hypothetical protein